MLSEAISPYVFLTPIMVAHPGINIFPKFVSSVIYTPLMGNPVYKCPNTFMQAFLGEDLEDNRGIPSMTLSPKV